GPVGYYNLFVDYVSFYRPSQLPSGTSDMPALPATSGAMKPFPQNATLAHCTKPTGADGKLLAVAYKNWKDNFVRTEGSAQKVIRPESNNDTVSEGIAYGMLISVYMNDKA